MSHSRLGMGVALLLAFAGSAAAQPAFPGPVSPGPMPSAPAQPGTLPPAFLPPNASYTPPAAIVPPGPPPSSNIQTLSAFANDAPPMKELPSEFRDLIPPPDKHHGHGHGEHEVPEWLTPFVPTHGGWYTGGEYLMMRPRDSGFEYAIRSASAGLATGGPIDSLKYPLSSGFRADLGYRFGEGKWESQFTYTFFGSHANNTIFAGAGQILLPTLTRPGLTDRVTSADADARLNYQLFDAIVGRRMMVDENFALRFIGGVRFAGIREKFNVLYDGADARRAAIDSRSQFRGFGPIVGTESVLGGWSGFHLYSRATLGLLSGLNSNPLLETNDNGATTYVNTINSVRKVVPMGTLSIGAGWQYRTLSIRAGYEITHWQGIYERPRFVDDVSQGKVIPRSSNLTLEGLFVQVGLNF